jgi:hypothetical protein
MTGMLRETAARERWRIYGGFLPEILDRYCFGLPADVIDTLFGCLWVHEDNDLWLDIDT